MFGSTRRAATKMATRATLPIVKSLEISALGYIYCTIETFAKASANGKLSGADLARCFFDCFTAISGRDGVTIGAQVNEFSDQQNSEFLKGMRIADMQIAIAYGAKDYDSDPDVVAANKMMEALGHIDFGVDRAPISGSLAMAFNKRIKERMGR